MIKQKEKSLGEGKAEYINKFGRIIVSEYAYVLISKTCECVPLLGKRAFAEVTKVTGLSWGDNPA